MNVHASFFDGAFLGGGFFDAGRFVGGRGATDGNARRIPIRFSVEVEGQTYYFPTEADALAFLKKRAKQVKKRVKVRKVGTFAVPQPSPRTEVPIPQSNPIPTFIANGSEALISLSAKINSQIVAALDDPDKDGFLDDEDIARLLQ